MILQNILNLKNTNLIESGAGLEEIITDRDGLLTILLVAK